MADSTKPMQINTFTGGMNLDDSDTYIKENEYREAENIKIITNKDSNYGNVKSISSKSDLPVFGGSAYGFETNILGDVVKTTKIRDILIVITTDDQYNRIYTIKIVDDNSLNTVVEKMMPNLVLKASKSEFPLTSKLSLVTHYEDFDNIKLYIADGESYIRVINIATNNYGENDIKFTEANPKYTNTNVLSFNIYPEVKFSEIHTEVMEDGGSLKIGKYQVGYQLFNPKGNSTTVSPLSNDVVVDNGNNPNEFKNENSTKCLTVKINTARYYGIFSKIRLIVFRYNNQKDLPEIFNYKEYNLPNGEFSATVTKTEGSAIMTIEDLIIAGGVKFIPKVIESKNNYLFAGDIQYVDSELAKDYDARTFRFCGIEGYRDQDGVGQYCFDTGNWDTQNPVINDLKVAEMKTYKKCVLYDDINGTPLVFSQLDFENSTVDSNGNIVLPNNLGVITKQHNCINPFNNITKTYHSFEPARRHMYDLLNGDPIYGPCWQITQDKYNDAKCDSFIDISDSRPATLNDPEFKKYTGITGGIGKNIKYYFTVGKLSGIHGEPNLHYASVENKYDYLSYLYDTKGSIFGKGSSYLPNGFEKSIKYVTPSYLGTTTVNKKYNIFKDSSVDYDKISYFNYKDNVIKSELRSLQRDELYRFGIVFYDKYGNKSDVKWIGDIRTPSSFEPGFETFLNNDTIGKAKRVDNTVYDRYTNLTLRPLNIVFEVTKPSGVAGYEIVYVKRNEQNRSVIGQCLATNAPYYRADQAIVSSSVPSVSASSHAPIKKDYLSSEYYTLISPEIAYNKDAVYDYLKDKRNKLNLVGLYFSKMLKSGEPEFFNAGAGSAIYGGYVASMENGNNAGTNQNIGRIVSYPGTGFMQDGESSGARYRCAGIASGDDPKTLTIIPVIQALSFYKLRKDEPVSNIESNLLVRRMFDVNGITKTNPELKYTQGSEIEMTFDIDGVKVRPFIHSQFADTGGELVYPTNSPYLRYYGNLGRNLMISSPEIGQHFADFLCGTTTPVANSNILKDDFIGAARFKDENFTVANSTSTYLLQLENYLTSDKFVCQPSAFSFILFNIVKNSDLWLFPTYSDRQLSTYIPCSKYTEWGDTNSTYVNGDTYIQFFDYTYAHLFNAVDGSSIGSTGRSKQMNILFPFETQIDLSVHQGVTAHNTIDGFDSAFAQIKPDTFNNQTTAQTKEMYQYDERFSRLPDVMTNTPLGQYDELNERIDTRVVHSELKTNDELDDSWSKFKPLNYIDLDTRYGAVNNLKTMNNRLFCFQNNATSILSVNERSLLNSGDESAQLVLGTGGVLSRYDYISNVNGMRYKDLDAIVSTEKSLYFVDWNTKQICVITDAGLIPLSKAKKVQSYLNGKGEINPMCGYDSVNNDVYFNFGDSDKRSLLFNETSQNFTTFVTSCPKHITTVDKYVTTVSKEEERLTPGVFANRVAILNSLRFSDSIDWFTPDGRIKQKLTYVVNSNPLVTKVFDNCEIVGDMYLPFTTVEHETKGQTGLVVTEGDISRREYKYQYCVPRENVPGTTYPGRLRGKSMTVTLNTANNTILGEDDLNISMIKTSFRQSNI